MNNKTGSNKYYEGDRPEVAKFLPIKYEKVLEIGCGDASFRRNLNINCEYWGVEPKNIELSSLGTKNIKILTGSFDEVIDELPDNYFDLIVCNDVIEHMPDHDIFFSGIKKKMNVDAVIVGSIPNVRYYENLFHVLKSKDWAYQDSGILDRTHLRFFTEKSLVDSFHSNGFEVEEFSGINNVLDKTRSIKKIFRIHYLLSVLFLLNRNNADIKFQQYAFRIKMGSLQGSKN